MENNWHEIFGIMVGGTIMVAIPWIIGLIFVTLVIALLAGVFWVLKFFWPFLRAAMTVGILFGIPYFYLRHAGFDETVTAIPLYLGAALYAIGVLGIIRNKIVGIAG